MFSYKEEHAALLSLDTSTPGPQVAQRDSAEGQRGTEASISISLAVSEETLDVRVTLDLHHAKSIDEGELKLLKPSKTPAQASAFSVNAVLPHPFWPDLNYRRAGNWFSATARHHVLLQEVSIHHNYSLQCIRQRSLSIPSH